MAVRKHQTGIDGVTIGPALRPNCEIRVFRHGLPENDSSCPESDCESHGLQRLDAL